MKFKFFLTVLVIILSSVVLAGCQDETFHNIYSTEQEQQMGRQASAQIDSTEKLDTDAADNSRVQVVAQAVFAQARKMRSDIPYQIKIIDSPEVNAFSLPGGYIYIYTGLLKKIGNDDDALAAVIGHESAHAVLKHVVKQMSDAGIKGLLVEMVGITTDNYDAYNASSAVYELEQLHYSREDEYQADKYGLMFAYNAGYDPQGMVRMLKKLEETGEGGGGDEYAMDHPITRNRVLRAEALIRILEANNGVYPANTDTLTDNAAALNPSSGSTEANGAEAQSKTGSPSDGSVQNDASSAVPGQNSNSAKSTHGKN